MDAQLSTLFTHAEDCMIFGTFFFYIFWKLKFIKSYLDTMMFSFLYTFGGLIQFWGK